VSVCVGLWLIMASTVVFPEAKTPGSLINILKIHGAPVLFWFNSARLYCKGYRVYAVPDMNATYSQKDFVPSYFII